jgi:hypothetical protein
MNSNQLQSTISASTSADGGQYIPHHPITCTSKLFFEEDGSFGCEHTVVPPDDPRTAACLRHSIALMIIELAFEKL